jgi:hypothetical protein
VDLLQTFISYRVQPLHQREMTMWIYLGPSCPDHPFSTELDGTEINTWIQGVLAHGADQNFGSSPVLLGEGVDNPWVEREALKRVSTAEAENTAVLASAREDAEDFV